MADGEETEGYSPAFFDTLEKASRRSAEIVVPMLLGLVHPQSVIDVGCGRGHWLSVFRDHGVTDVLGLDGEYIDAKTLDIPPSQFRAVDLSAPFSLPRSFDLALCLEVAEHLPVPAADGFIDSLVRLSPVIAFSAAIPNQGGVHHVNEQWPHYWVERFAGYGYLCADVLRPRIWNSDEVEYWYAQNLLLLVRKDALTRYPSLQPVAADASVPVAALVHPKKYLEVCADLSDARAQAEEWRNASDGWQKACNEWQACAHYFEEAAKPENMTLRQVLSALPVVLRAAIRRRLRRRSKKSAGGPPSAGQPPTPA
jgi:SAM-dependent methyltransferase